MSKTLIILFITSIFLYFSLSLFLYSPPIWPDETYIADISRNLMLTGQLSTKLWGEMIPSADKQVLWYPPAMFYILAAAFKIFGGSVEVQRFVSVVLGSWVLIAFFFLVKSLVKDTKGHKYLILIASISTLMLSLDNYFLRAARMSRPEIYVLFFGIISLVIFLQSKKRLIHFSLSGFFAGLAGLVHVEGLIFGFAIFFHLIFGKRFLSKQLLFFITGFILVFSLWIPTIYSNFSDFAKVISLQSQFRAYNPNFLTLLYRSGSINQIITTSFYLLITLYFIFYFRLNFKKYLSIYLILIFTWVFAILGKLAWYPALTMPFVYIALTLSFGNYVLNSSQGKLKRIVFCMALFLLVALNLKIFLEDLESQMKNYHKFNAKILEMVPSGKVVYISTIPDPYWGFIQRGENKLLYFPPLPTSAEKYLKHLNSSDFIVLNQHFEALFMGDILNRFLELNLKNKTDLYYEGDSTSIIELKPKNLRVMPTI